MQDLTPQLRTRLGRVERAVGIFVGLATLLLVAGICYYVYHTAQRKGWLDTKVRYYTYLRSGAGLKPKEIVKLLGFEAGEIKSIVAMPPESGYEVYVEFEIRHPNEGYIWSEGSHINVTSSGMFGGRLLEVTKGTNGYPSYMFHDLREMTISDLKAHVGKHEVLKQQLAELKTIASKEEMEQSPRADPKARARQQDMRKMQIAELEDKVREKGFAFAQDYFSKDAKRIAEVTKPVGTSELVALDAAKTGTVRVFDQRTHSRLPTFIWYDAPFYETADIKGYYVAYVHRGPKPSKFYLNARESVALNEVIDNVSKQVMDALPIVLGMTNQIKGILDTSHTMLSNVNELSSKLIPIVTNASNTLVKLQPTLDHVAQITFNLTNAHGSLGQWLITAQLQKQIDAALGDLAGLTASATNTLADLTNKLALLTTSATNMMTNVNTMLGFANQFMTNTHTNIAFTVSNLSRTLEEVTGITSGLRKQVEANTNFLSEVSKAIIHADDLLQGIKKHWLIRSAFKTNAPPKAPSTPRSPSALPPRKD